MVCYLQCAKPVLLPCSQHVAAAAAGSHAVKSTWHPAAVLFANICTVHTPTCCCAGSTSLQRPLGLPLSEALEASVSTAMLAPFQSHTGGVSHPSLNTLESDTRALLAHCSPEGPHNWGVASTNPLNDSMLDDVLVPGLNMGQFDF